MQTRALAQQLQIQISSQTMYPQLIDDPKKGFDLPYRGPDVQEPYDKRLVQSLQVLTVPKLPLGKDNDW